MSTQLNFIEELQKLRALEGSYPPRIKAKPRKTDNQTNQEYGRVLDEYELELSSLKMALQQHDNEVKAQAGIVKNAILDDLGILNHPRSENIWEYAWRETHSSNPYIDTHSSNPYIDTHLLIMELLEVFGE